MTIQSNPLSTPTRKLPPVAPWQSYHKEPQTLRIENETIDEACSEAIQEEDFERALFARHIENMDRFDEDEEQEEENDESDREKSN